MEHNLQHTISLLTRTPAVLDALLRDLPEVWTLRNEGENTWSAFDIVGHLEYANRRGITAWGPYSTRVHATDLDNIFDRMIDEEVALEISSAGGRRLVRTDRCRPGG